MAAEIQLKLLKEHGREEIFLSLARVPAGSRVLVGASDGNVYDVDPLAEKPEFTALPGHASFVTGVAVAGELFISGGYDCKLLWRKLDGGEVAHTIENAHSRWIRKLAASPDGRLVASVADDMVLRVWEAVSGKLVHELRGHEEQTPHHFPSMLYACAFSADGQRLATADKSGRLCVWDAASGNKLQQLEAPGFYTWDPKQRIHSIGGTRSVAFSPDGKQLVAGGIGTIGNIDHLDGPARVEVFNLESGKSEHVFSEGAKGLVEQLLFHPEGKWLLGVGGDNGGLVQVYDLAEKKVTHSDKAPMHIHAAALNEDGTQLFAAGHGKVAVWEIS
jgi:WD40 repeat protein